MKTAKNSINKIKLLLLWTFYVFTVLCLLCLCARLFICALWSPAGKGLTSWLSFEVSNCEFVTFPLVSWVRCGTSLYRFLIFAPFLTCLIFDFELWYEDISFGLCVFLIISALKTISSLFCVQTLLCCPSTASLFCFQRSLVYVWGVFIC